jgi:hypothetical protein
MRRIELPSCFARALHYWGLPFISTFAGWVCLSADTILVGIVRIRRNGLLEMGVRLYASDQHTVVVAGVVAGRWLLRFGQPRRSG